MAVAGGDPMQRCKDPGNRWEKNRAVGWAVGLSDLVCASSTTPGDARDEKRQRTVHTALSA